MSSENDANAGGHPDEVTNQAPLGLPPEAADSGTVPSPDSSPLAICRARIYLLDESGPAPVWDARGTGVLTVDHVANQTRLVVISETDNMCLMNVAISAAIAYHLRQSTVITWSDSGIEIGLSFENSDGCSAVWEQICVAQGKPAVFEPESADTDDAASAGSNGDSGAGVVDEPLSPGQRSEGSDSIGSVFGLYGPVELPVPSRGTISTIAATITRCSATNSVTLADELLKDDCRFLMQFFAVFEQMEDLSDMETLFEMYTVMKNIVLLNDLRVLHALMADRMFHHFVGVLEYETAFPFARQDGVDSSSGGSGRSAVATPIPESPLIMSVSDSEQSSVLSLPPAHIAAPSASSVSITDAGLSSPCRKPSDAQVVTHREFLKSESHLRLPLALNDTTLIARIHETFRLEYIRDVVLARALDDPVVGTLTHLITSNHTETISSFVADPAFISDLLAMVQYGKREACDYRDGFAPEMDRDAPEPLSSVQSSQATAVAASQLADAANGAVKRPAGASASTDDDESDDDLFIGPKLPPSTAESTQSSQPTSGSSSGNGSTHIVTGTVIGPTGLRRDALSLLQDLCNTVKPLRPAVRVAFFKALFDKSPGGRFYNVLEALIRDITLPVRDVVKALDIMMTLLQYEPSRLRNYILSQKNVPVAPVSIAVTRGAPTGPLRAPSSLQASPAPSTAGAGHQSTTGTPTLFPRGANKCGAADGGHVGLVAVDEQSPLLQLLIWRLVEDPDTGVQTQVVDVLKGLLDLDTAMVRGDH